MLVEFQAGRTPGFAFEGMQDELSEILGRRVDLNTVNSLSKYFRDDTVPMRHMPDHLVEIIGEAANRVSGEGRSRDSYIAWQDAINTRNRFIHGYDTVDYDIVWKIATQELPVLIAALERALPGHVS